MSKSCNHSKGKLTRIAALWALGGFAMTCALGGAFGLGSHHSGEAVAQGIASHDSRAPVSFDAGSIDVDGRANRVVLSGGVEINQAGLNVRSNRMLADYNNNGSLDVERITANGGVVVSRGNERASGDVAIYDLGRRIITMAGNVKLSRGSDRLEGGRLVIDLASGRSSVDGRASGGAANIESVENGSGRVRGTFSVPQN